MDAIGEAEVGRRPRIELVDVVKRFGSVTVLDDVSLRIEDHDFFVLLGPSGCGKSTLLRVIAGLEPTSAGDVLIDGVSVADDEPAKRDVAFVFQSYALYPHLTVRKNIAFPLIMRRFRWWHHLPGVGWAWKRRMLRSPGIGDRVRAVAEGLGLTAYLDRYPVTLSGGQRQRVALGRAMVRDPRAFLMDEPLSNLDASLRGETRTELVNMHRALDATVVYVTHDQVEAMTMGTRIAVMRQGEIVQVGEPRDVYENPVNVFVAKFLGTPPMNILSLARQQDGRWYCGDSLVRLDDLTAGPINSSDRALLGIRAEHISLSFDPAAEGIAGTVTLVEDWGAELLVRVKPESRQGGSDRDSSSFDIFELEGDVCVRVASSLHISESDDVVLQLDLGHCVLFDPATGEALARDPLADVPSEPHRVSTH